MANVYTRRDLTPTLIENTTMQIVAINGVDRLYEITPCDGYVLHDNEIDIYDNYDDEGNPIGEPSVLGFQVGTTSVAIARLYTRDFYAIPETDVPENSYICGDTTKPEPEIM